jgi:hypothetical protein
MSGQSTACFGDGRCEPHKQRKFVHARWSELHSFSVKCMVRVGHVWGQKHIQSAHLECTAARSAMIVKHEAAGDA